MDIKELIDSKIRQYAEDNNLILAARSDFTGTFDSWKVETNTEPNRVDGFQLTLDLDELLCHPDAFIPELKSRADINDINARKERTCVWDIMEEDFGWNRYFDLCLNIAKELPIV